VRKWWIVVVGMCCVGLGCLVFLGTLVSGILKKIADRNPEVLLWLAVALFFGGWMVVCVGYVAEALSKKQD